MISASFILSCYVADGRAGSKVTLFCLIPFTPKLIEIEIPYLMTHSLHTSFTIVNCNSHPGIYEFNINRPRTDQSAMLLSSLPSGTEVKRERDESNGKLGVS